MGLKNQFRSIIQWEDPQQWQIFHRFTNRGDEIKNASKLILQPGQGCLFTYEGKVEAIFEQEGIYDLKTENTPFWTTIAKFLNYFESEHKVGLWFYRSSQITNIRWGTRIPITYNDPVYAFPVNLRGFGNYSIQISDAESFFRNIVAGQDDYYCGDLQELFLSRISQPITNYLANAKFSYADIDSHLEEIALEAKNKSEPIFQNLGFDLLDFRIEGTSFDDETNRRIGEISDVQADAHAAKIAGLGFAELQQLKALRDIAKNEGPASSGMGLFAGMELGKQVNQSPSQTSSNQSTDIKTQLQNLKSLFEEELITEEEYQQKRSEILSKL